MEFTPQIVLMTALSVMVKYFVNTKKMTWMDVIDRMSTRPAEIFNLPGGTLMEGAPGDVTVIHPGCKWVVSDDTLIGKSKNSAFLGMELEGCVRYTIIEGHVVFGHE